METLFIYIAKSSGLIGIFYLAYYFLLRKETFFNSNRWFLLAGLITSVILPLIVFTKIVWVYPTPTTFDWSKIPMTTNTIENEPFEINWYLVLAIAYTIGTVLFLAQFALDFYQLNRVLKGKISHRQADHKLIDLKENIAPFSYFNTIVYNSSLYSESEMESILEHEKVHSEQYHTIDVLITRFFCILFWFNPFMWLYKNAILQNLEFIADSKASKNIADKKVYQLTLLKITTHENCVVLTNHFYQSLIKKRIVMLNKNQSKKWNSWKYAVVLPALVAFVFLFQMEVIAKEKNLSQKTEQSTSNDPDVYKINKNTTEAELKEKAAILSEKYAIKTTFSKVKRNSKNELIGLKIKLQKGKEIATVTEVNGSEPIKDFAIAISKNDNGTTNIGIVIQKSKVNDKSTVTSNATSPNLKISDDTHIFINEEKSSEEELAKLDSKEIESIDKGNSDKIHPIPSIPPVPPAPPVPPVKKKEASQAKLNTEQSAKKDAEHAKKDANQAKIVAQQAVKNAEQNKKIAIEAKIIAEQAVKDAEHAKKGADQAKLDAEQAKIEASQVKSKIGNTSKTALNKEQWLETYKVIMKARFSLEKMNAQKEQAKVDLEKAKKILESKLFS